MNPDRPYDPVTIENAVELGLTGVILYCRKCSHSGAVTFKAISFPGET